MNNFKIFIETTFRMAVWAILFSAFFSLCKWLLSLVGIANKVTWTDFIWGAIALFLLQFLYSTWCVIKYFLTHDRANWE